MLAVLRDCCARPLAGWGYGQPGQELRRLHAGTSGGGAAKRLRYSPGPALCRGPGRGECDAGQSQQRGDPGLDWGARSQSKPWSGRYAAYRSSKTALNALTLFYAHTLADDGIKVNALAPGLRRTDLNASAGPPV